MLEQTASLEKPTEPGSKALRSTYSACDLAKICRGVIKDERRQAALDGYQPEHNRFTVVDAWLRDRLYGLVMRTHSRRPKVAMFIDNTVSDVFIRELVGPLKKETLVTNTQLQALAMLVSSGYPDDYCRESTIEQYILTVFKPNEVFKVELDIEYEDIMLTLSPEVSLEAAIAAIDKITSDH